MKSADELRRLEQSISKSNAPSKTRPVTEPLFRSIGKEREPLPMQAEAEDEVEEDSVEAKVDPRKYIHTLRSSIPTETNSTSTNTSLNPTVGKV